MCDTIETHDAVDEIEAGYETVEYVIDLNKSDDPEYGRKVERLVNDTVIEAPNTGSDALLIECEHCGHRQTHSAYDDRPVANVKALCPDCGVAGGTWHDDHRIVGVKVSDDEADDETDADDLEIVSDGGKDVTSHIDDAEIEDAIERHDDPDHPDALTVEEVRDLLADIQLSFVEYWDEHMDVLEDGGLEVVEDAGDVVVLADHTGHGWSEELKEFDVDDVGRSVIMSVHHAAAKRLTDYSWSTSDPFVIRKPGGDGGQRYVEAVVNGLINQGLSPGQAWAVYGVHVAGHSRNAWASMCGYSDHSAVSEPLRKVNEKTPYIALVE